jgi:hypothetical protein
MATHITTAAGFQNISADLTADYILDNSIDFSNTTLTPLGTAGSPFTGSLDGQGFSLMNLNVTYGTSTVDQGIFGHIQGATIDDVILENCTMNLSITQSISDVGLLIGDSSSTVATVTNFLTDIVMIGIDINITNNTESAILTNFGILMGKCLYAEVSGCTIAGLLDYTHSPSTTSTSSIDQMGGLIGYIDESTTVSVSSTALTMNLTGSQVGTHLFTNWGGFIGRISASNVTIQDSNCSGTFTFDKGDSDEIGGFIGLSSINNGLIDNCYSSVVMTFTNFTDSSCLGGFISTHSATGGGTSLISNSHSSGTFTFTGLSMGDGCGGFGKYIFSSLSNCYTTITLTATTTGTVEDVGGFAGAININGSKYIEDCYNSGNINITCVNSFDIAGFAATIFVSGSAYITRCHSTGEIDLDCDSITEIGGFSGAAFISNNAYISECYSTGDIDIISDDNVDSAAGFGGYVNISNSGLLYDFYTRSDLRITMTDAGADIQYSGGAIGITIVSGSSSIRNGYTTTAITTTFNNTKGTYQDIGGFIGRHGPSGTFILQNVFGVGIMDLASGSINTGGFIGYLIPNAFGSTGSIDNCAWYTSQHSLAVGTFRDFTSAGVYTEHAVDLLADESWGTDEPDNTKFQTTTDHVVFDQGKS